MSRLIICELSKEEVELFDDIMGHTDVGPDKHENDVFRSMLDKLKYQE